MKTTPHLITYKKETNTISGWARKLGIRPGLIHSRLKQGWTMEEILTTPARPRAANAVRCTLPAPEMLVVTQQHLAMYRQVNSRLRQFNRDLQAILQGGVGLDLLKSLKDRSIPVTRDLPEIGNS